MLQMAEGCCYFTSLILLKSTQKMKFWLHKKNRLGNFGTFFDMGKYKA